MCLGIKDGIAPKGKLPLLANFVVSEDPLKR
jgi:hypothetical protein